MEQSKAIHLIACGVLAPDMKRIAAQLNISLTMNFLPGGLHNRPDELRRQLQQAIDAAAKLDSCDRIVIGYGICGRGAVGIKAPHVPLVMPRIHDCIALFMGSDQVYKKEFAQHPGTFYLSAGWYREKGRPTEDENRKIWIGAESLGCRELMDKYGEEGGRRIIDFFSTWHHNYQRAAFIDTGTDNSLIYEEYAREMAREHNWQFARITGDLSLMTRLLTQNHSDDQLLVVPPGHFTIYSPFTDGLDSAPRLETAVPNQSATRHMIHDEEEDLGLAIRYGLGIDAGGTYTDAVIWDFQKKKILHKHKALTTKWDFTIGIDNALSGLDAGLLSRAELVSVSTTLATNAIIEGEGQKTGLLLMDGGGMVDGELISHVPRYRVKGYINISGEEIEPVDEEEIRTVARKMAQLEGVTAFAVSGFAGSINPAHELAVKRLIEEETGMVTCCGHEFSDLLNFIVRAQTAVFNARIIPRMIKFFRELEQVLEKRRITAPVMVVKGDGTLMADAMARERPVETTLSGPAASVAGAKLLTGLRDAMVVDMGGTTTDIADICDGMVAICENGAHVGGLLTHVKALDMRTSGLGGDSLIRRQAGKGEFTIGPRRVGPLAWASHISEGSVSEALRYMEQRGRVNLEQVVFVAMEGQFPFEPTEQESTIFQLLRQRPHAPEELTAKLNIMSTLFLPMTRMEESGLVQRCGLTPTDLLHVKGDFTRWDAEPAKRMLAMLSSWTNMAIPELIDELLGKIHQQLAFELLKKQLYKDLPEEEMERSPVARQLLLKILAPGQQSGPTSRYQLKAELHHPVIGIGAPAQYFLPQAGKLVNAEVIIPPDADVANALGAITSRIMVKQKLVICPNSLGRFVVEGVAGNQTFRDISEAEAWSVAYLKDSVRAKALKAGTTRKTVAIEINDRVAEAGNGLSLFLHRSITATLQGSPDLVAASAGASDPRITVVQL
jgi:N-methylhydantoinase A/oxoprolinase/acetone carboxylase beta subunit